MMLKSLLNHDLSWLFSALFAAGIICMICAFVQNGNSFDLEDPVAFIMFSFYAVAIIVMLVGLVLSCRDRVAKVIEYNHTV